MKNIQIITILVFAFLLFTLPGPLVEKVESKTAQPQKKAELPEVRKLNKGIKKLDKRAWILSQYLKSYNSPMQNHAQDFVDAAAEYNLDWRLLPSIAGVESTFGKKIPGGFNAYGWGVYGTNALAFKSWRDGMFTVGKGLRENYINRGYTEPYAMNRIYASSPTWGSRVSYFMEDLEKFAQKYQFENYDLEIATFSAKIAAISGKPR